MQVIFVIVAILSSLAMGTCGVIATWGYQVRKGSEKRTITPNVHYPHEGLCQCGDAFCYHAGSLACQVKNCDCQMFISSTMPGEEIDKMSIATIASRTAELEMKAIEHQATAATRASQIQARSQYR